MSLKSFDINYGFNGEPSTASVTIVAKIGGCNASGSSAQGNLNGSLTTGNSTIDNLIRDYIISSKEEVVQAGFKEIKYQLVDKMAKRLGSIAVLVRGITASPKGDPFKNSSLIYDASEVKGKGGFNSDGISIKNNGRVAVIGKTFSTISATEKIKSTGATQGGLTITEKEETATRVYNAGKVVFSQPSNPSSELVKKLNLEDTIAGASIRHGYYVSELQSLITQCGYSVTNFPTADKNLILDFGGSLKDCVSSLASMFGLFYICRGNRITFYKTSQLQSLQVPNFNNNSDQTILSSSFSEDLLGKQTVGVIRGSVAPNTSSSFSSITSYGGGGFARSKTINFYRVSNEEVFQDQDLVSSMFSIFRLGGSKDLFDRIIMSYMLRGTKPSDASLFSNYNLQSSESKKLSDIVSDSQKNEIEKNMPWLSQKTKLYALQEDFKLPSQTELYGILDSLCKSTGGLYVSQGVGSATARDFTVTASEGFTISQPYLGSTPIGEIAELKGIVGLFAACGAGIAAKSLSSFAKRGTGTRGKPIGDKLYYIGIYDLMHKASDTSEAANAIKSASSDMRGTIVTINDKQYYAESDSEKSAYQEVITSSRGLYESLSSSVAEQVRGKATEITEDKPDSNQEEEGEEEEEIEYPANYISFVVRAPSDDSISDISIAKFEGTVDEASYMSSNFSSLIQDKFNSKRSSVTYSGLKIPSESPLLVNVSVQFSEGTVQTTIEYSNVEFVAESNEVIMSQYAASSKMNVLRSLTAKQKNALGLN